MKHLIRGAGWTFAACVTLNLVFAGVGKAAIDVKNIAALYYLDDNKGGTAVDSSGKGNDATLVGNVKWVAGKYGKAVEFDGSGAHLSALATDSLSMKEAITVTFWVRTDKKMLDMWADRQIVVGKHYTEYEVGMYLNGQVHTYTWGDNANGYDEGIMTTINGKHPDGDADWLKDKWYHLAWTLKGKHEIAYINGVIMAEYDKATENTRPGGHSLDIGQRQGGGLPLTGAVDEVAILNVALDKADIAAIATKGLGMATGLMSVDPAGKLTTTWARVKKP